MILLYIALGGAAGAVARYGLGGWVQGRLGHDFPWGTLVVNVLGSLLIGLALRYLEAVDSSPPAWPSRYGTLWPTSQGGPLSSGAGPSTSE